MLLVFAQSFARFLLVIMLTGDPVGLEMSLTVPGRVFIAAELLDGALLFVNTLVFVFMDCIIVKAPRMRMVLGLTLTLSMLDGLWRRSRFDFPSEQGPIVPAGLNQYFSVAGGDPKQQYISTFDFSVASLLFAGVMTTIKWPQKMAFIRLRGDLYGLHTQREVEYRAKLAKRRWRRVHSIAPNERKLAKRNFKAGTKTGPATDGEEAFV